MLSIDDYIDAARKETETKSDRQLSTLMGMALGAVGMYRIARAFPSDETMITLARLAKMDERLAVLHLGWWRSVSKNEHEAATLYLSMIEQYQQQAA